MEADRPTTEGPIREAEGCSPTWTHRAEIRRRVLVDGLGERTARREYGIPDKTERVRDGLGGGLRPDAG